LQHALQIFRVHSQVRGERAHDLQREAKAVERGRFADRIIWAGNR
jgi:hypothetical protein